MKAISLYTETQVSACFSVIVELLTYLKKYSSHIVLVGGWVPYFLYGELKEDQTKHVGSLDVAVISHIPTGLVSNQNVINNLPVFFRTMRGEKPSREELEELIKLMKKE